MMRHLASKHYLRFCIRMDPFMRASPIARILHGGKIHASCLDMFAKTNTMNPPHSKIGGYRMGFKSARETAEAWGVSERLVQRLCATGRIADAQKLGGSWIVPANAQKPEDPRKEKRALANPSPEAAAASSKATRSQNTEADAGPSHDDAFDKTNVFSRLMPLMNSSFKPGCCQATIDGFPDPAMRDVAQAEYRYFSGQAEEAARIAGSLLDHNDLAIRLSARLIYAYANLPLGNINKARFALAELRFALRKTDAHASVEAQSIEAFVAYTASVLLHLPLPEGLPPAKDFLALLPAGLRSFSLYVAAHQLYLQGDYARSLGTAEAALTMGGNTYPIPEIYLHMVAVMDCMSLKQVDEAREHLLAAWELARPDGLIEAFGEHHGLLGGMLESVIKKDWPDDFKRIIDITYRFSAGWRRVHNPATEETVADNLSTTEFTVSMLAVRGWTNQEIGTHLEISANTVKSYLASSFRKLGISKRQDLGKYMLR